MICKLIFVNTTPRFRYAGFATCQRQIFIETLLIGRRQNFHLRLASVAPRGQFWHCGI